MSAPAVNLKNRALAGLLAFLVPGLGHWYQGRRGKAILYAVCILGLFGFGLVLGEFKIAYWRWIDPRSDPENFRLPYLAQFFVGLPALPALIQATLRHYGYDPILWGYLDVPTLQAINALHPPLGKLVEVGTVYTEVAGLLNILAIYDALEGPAEPEPEADPAAPPPPPAADRSPAPAGGTA